MISYIVIIKFYLMNKLKIVIYIKINYITPKMMVYLCMILLIKKVLSLLTKEKVYSLKISIDGKYLSYITDSTKKNKEIKIIIKDLKKNKIVYVRDA